MTEITREGDIKLDVISYGCRRKAKEKKTDNEQLTWKRKKKNKLKTEKQIYMPNQWILKNLKKREKKKQYILKKIWKKEKRRTRKCFGQKKNGKNENEGRYEHFFVFTDFWVLGLLHVLLSCFYILLLHWCYCNFVINSTWGRTVHLFKKNNLSSITDDFILWGGKVCYIIAEGFFLYNHFSFYISYLLV